MSEFQLVPSSSRQVIDHPHHHAAASTAKPWYCRYDIRCPLGRIELTKHGSGESSVLGCTRLLHCPGSFCPIPPQSS